MELKIINSSPDFHKNCAIIMPAYNEQEALASVIKQWHDIAVRINASLVVINDGSKDQTLKLLSDNLQNYSHLIVFDKENSGHGPTCLAGYNWALQKKFEWIFQTDSDGQIDPKDFERAWQLRADNDFILGNRPQRGDGAIRWFISRILQMVIFTAFGVNVPDANVPFRLMKVMKLQELTRHIPSDFFLANAYLAVLIQKFGRDVKWVDISFSPRSGGVPSVSLKRYFGLGCKVTRDFFAISKSFKKI